MENERERDVIAGRNAVTEALKAGRPIDSILVRRGEKNGSVSSILRMAKQAGIPVKEVDSRKLDGMCGGENHQGIIAMAAVHAFSEVEDIFALAESRNEPPFILVCDEIADPHNLGAILRTAECAGAHGVVIPKRRSVGLTAAAFGYTPRIWTARIGAKPISPARQRLLSAPKASACPDL